MSRYDRFPLPSDEEFERIAVRYCVVPGSIWIAAIMVAVLTALCTPAGGPQESDRAAMVAAGTFRADLY